MRHNTAFSFGGKKLNIKITNKTRNAGTLVIEEVYSSNSITSSYVSKNNPNMSLIILLTTQFVMILQKKNCRSYWSFQQKI